MLTRAKVVRASLAAAMLASGAPAFAATCTANASGNWGTAGIWSCGNVPVNGDNVVIPNGVTVTLNVNSARIADLNVQAGGVLQGDNTNKTFTINNGTGTDITNNGTIDFGPGKLATLFTRQSTTWAGAGNWTLSEIDLNGNTLGFAGGTTATITMAGVAAPFANPGTVNSLTTITWDFSGAVAQTLPNSTNVKYGNVIVSNTAGTTFGVTMTSTNILGNLTVASGGILNNGGFSTTLASGKSLSVQANGTLNLTGTTTMVAVSGGGTKTFDAASTVNYGGASQSVTAETYGNLQLTGSGTKTMAAGTTTIAGDLTLAAGVTYNGTTNNPTVSLAGNFTHGGTFNSGTGTFTFNGGAAQTLGGAAAGTTFARMTVNNTGAGLTLGHDATVSTLLTLSNGVVSTGTNTLITSTFCPAGITRTGGHVFGKLELRFNTGARTCTFDVGDATTYSPITTAFTNISAAGGLIGTATGSDFADANLPVDPVLDVNRYWTLAPPASGALTSAGTYTATMNYVSGDNDASTTPSKYLVGKGDTCGPSSCTTWSFPTLSGVPTNLQAAASGIGTFGVLVVGEHRVFGFRVDNPGSPPGTSIPDQTQGVAFNVRVTAIDPQGNTVTEFTGTVDISSGCTLSAGGTTTAAFAAGVLATHSVTVSSTGSCSITAKKTGDATRSGTSNLFNVAAGVASFNAFETSTAANATTGVIKTRIAAAAFSLDVVAVTSGGTQASGFSGNVKVELLANTGTPGGGYGADRCPTSNSVIQTIASAAISGGRSTVAFSAVAGIYRDVRVRVSYPTASPTVTSCSNDSFAIRPDHFAATTGSAVAIQATHANRTTAGTTTAFSNTAMPGGQVHNAGRPFSLRVAAYDATGAVVTAYAGTITAALAQCSAGTPVCPASPSAANLGLGTWTVNSGTLSTDTAAYSDIGSFSLTLQDATFAAVDAGDPSPNHVISSSAFDVGRFVPDHFALDTTAGATKVIPRNNLCSPTSSFTYMDEPLQLAFKLQAHMYPSGVLTRYASGALASPASPGSAFYGLVAKSGATDVTTVGVPRLALSVGAPSWSNGVLNVAGTLTYIRNGVADGPFSAVQFAIAPVDSDGVALDPASLDLDIDNNAANDHLKIGATSDIFYGRLRIIGNSGASNVRLPIQVRAEYWNGTVFAVNSADSCTTIDRSQVAMSFAGLASCASAFGIAPSPTSITLASGAQTWLLSAPGASASGAVDMRVNLNGATGNACTPGASAAGSATLPFLQYRWTTAAGGFTDDPIARATFGTYGQDRLPNNVIFRRENF